jgi:hypothetical protein
LLRCAVGRLSDGRTRWPSIREYTTGAKIQACVASNPAAGC